MTMFRLLIKIVVLLILVGLAYGLWLTYREKSPEEQEEFRRELTRTVEGAAHTLGEAGRKAGEKGLELIKGDRDREGE